MRILRFIIGYTLRDKQRNADIRKICKTSMTLLDGGEKEDDNEGIILMAGDRFAKIAKKDKLNMRLLLVYTGGSPNLRRRI